MKGERQANGQLQDSVIRMMKKLIVQETMGQSNIVVFCLIKKLPLIGEINVKW